MAPTGPPSKIKQVRYPSVTQHAVSGLAQKRETEREREESGSLVLRKCKKRRIEWWCLEGEYDHEYEGKLDSKKETDRQRREAEEETGSSDEVGTKTKIARQTQLPPSSSSISRSSSILSTMTTATSSAPSQTKESLQTSSLPTHLLLPPPLRVPRRTVKQALEAPHSVLSSTLSWKAYQPYLGQQKIEAHLSFDYHRLQLEFFCSIIHFRYWATRPDSRAFIKSTFGWLHNELLTTRLDYEKIRIELPLGPSNNYERGVREYSKLWRALLDVISRVYGREVSESETYFFLENAPPAVLNLVRLQADTRRFGIAINHARKEFHSFLLSRPLDHLTPSQQRARHLINWLSASPDQVHPSRWELFWSEEVKQIWERKKSLVLKWMDASAGWQDIRGLERWENEVITLRNAS